MNYTPATKELAHTGVAGFLGLSITQSIMATALIIIIAGVLIAISRLAPRFALEPVPDETGKYHVRLTLNGRPVPWRKQ